VLLGISRGVVDVAGRLRKQKAKGDSLTARILQENTILRGLGGASASAILEYGTFVRLSLRQQIYTPEEPIQVVYFPFDSVLSIVTRMADGSQIEVGTIGREGMSAFPLIMGASATANDCYCQVRGTSARIPVGLFRELSSIDDGFRQLLDRYLQAYVNMLVSSLQQAALRLRTLFPMAIIDSRSRKL
jgi:CRP-like cAMP-binding protein